MLDKLAKVLWLLSSLYSVNALAQSAPMTQQQLDQLAQSLQVSYQHLDNRPDQACDKDRAGGKCFKVQLSFTATMDLAANNWQIYFSHIAPMQSFVSAELMMTHVNGDLHRIAPSIGFEGFHQGQSKTIEFRADGWSISQFDALPNYYIVATGLTPKIIDSTRVVIDSDTQLETRPFVKPYLNGEDTSEKDKHFKRLANETTQWATAQQLFDNNADVKIFSRGKNQPGDRALAQAIIPTPKRLSYDNPSASLDLSQGINVNYNNIDKEQVVVALARLDTFGVKQDIKGVRVNLLQVTDLNKLSGSYSLSIKADRIDITAVDGAGAAYGLNSLAALITLGDTTVPLLEVEDEPRYEFRGMHLDVARNFHSKALVMRLLDQMAAYKLNKLHLHLADDEGWRLAIKDLDELTEVGSKRCYDPAEDHCLLTQLGSGPEADTSVNGFYTREDYIEILRAASKRHIQVIPSLDMPGHSRAAVKSMEARYRKFIKVEDSTAAEQYLLSDFKDTTVYESIQYYSDNTINVCMPSAYRFVEKVIDEVMAMHNEASHPLWRYHIGADETAGAWVKSPECVAFLANNEQGIKDSKQLGSYFVEQVAGMLEKKGVETAAWGDGLIHTRVENMPKSVQANAWTPLFGHGYKQAHQLANRQWQVVISSPDATYFDFPYEADPKELGYYWASRQTNSRKVFEFMPDNLPLHGETRTDNIGNPQTFNDEVPLNAGVRFQGLQGQLWSENIRTDKQVEYMIFPRMLALAERAWHKPQWVPAYNHKGGQYGPQSNVLNEQLRAQRLVDWTRFANALGQKELPKLDLQGVFYRIPTVGAKLISGQLVVNQIFPGLVIEYQINNQPWQIFTQPIDIKQNDQVSVRAVASDGQRKGRILTVQ